MDDWDFLFPDGLYPNEETDNFDVYPRNTRRWQCWWDEYEEEYDDYSGFSVSL